MQSKDPAREEVTRGHPQATRGEGNGALSFPHENPQHVPPYDRQVEDMRRPEVGGGRRLKGGR